MSDPHKLTHRFKTWQQHFLNMTKHRRYTAMYWCRRAGKTYTATYFILERMLRTPYFSVCAYNDSDLIPILNQIIHRDEYRSRVVTFSDNMIVMDNGSYVFSSIGVVKSDLLYVNDFNTLDARLPGQIYEMYKLGVLNELLISTTGGSDNLLELNRNLPNLHIDFIDWRHIIDDIKYLWMSDEDWKKDLISEIGKEQFDKDYETNIDEI